MNNQHLLITPLLILLLTACSSVSDERPDPIRKSEYYLENGVTAFTNSDFVAATDFFNKALAHYRSLDDNTGILQSRINLAETALILNKLDAATRHIEVAEKIAAAPHYRDYQSRLTLLKAQINWRKKEREKTLALLEPLLPGFDDKHRPDQPISMLLIGATILRTDIAFSQIDSDITEVHLWLNRLAEMLRRADEPTPLQLARQLRFEAQLDYHQGQTQAALDKQEEALVLYREAAARPAIATTLTESAHILMEAGEWQRAEERLQRALYIRLWIIDQASALETISLLQQVYGKLGDMENLQRMNEEADKISSSMKRQQ
jgi:tetratricopeptide (TPR) repeat protein